MNYLLEFGGGLGDIFYQLYERGAYNVLRDLGPDDTATVLLVTHNPNAHELFTWHPKRDQITVRNLGYWLVEDDAKVRAERNLPPPGANWSLPEKSGPITYYPRPEDEGVLAALRKLPYVVFAPSAGMPDRFIPDDIVDSILTHLEGHTVIWVGSSYDRHGRVEYTPTRMYKGLITAIDQLSVPGVAQLVQGARGLVTSHSALNLLGWRENVPQLLLYPQSVLDRHCPRGQFDQWMYGANRPNTVHAVFDQYNPGLVSQFVERLR